MVPLVYSHIIHHAIGVFYFIVGVVCVFCGYVTVAYAFPEHVDFYFEALLILSFGFIYAMVDAISMDSFFMFAFLFVVGNAIAYILHGREFNILGIRIRCI